MLPRARLQRLLLRAAEPREVFRTGFQRRCIQQALFLMLRNPTFLPCAVEVGLALERCLSHMTLLHVTVLLRALHPEFPVARALITSSSGSSPPTALSSGGGDGRDAMSVPTSTASHGRVPTSTRSPLVAATVARCAQLASSEQTAFVGHVFHFMTTRKVVGSRSSPPVLALLRSLEQARKIEPATWVALVNWLVDTPFDRTCRALLQRLRTECPSLVTHLTVSQLQSLLYALAAIVSRFRGGGECILATLAMLATQAADIPARQLVGCAYSAHVAAVGSQSFMRAAAPYIAAEVEALAPWELLHAVLAFDVAIPVGELEIEWHVIMMHCSQRAEEFAIDVSLALLARFVGRTCFDAWSYEETDALQRWAQVTLEQLLLTPPNTWRPRELRRLGSCVAKVGLPEATVERLRRVAQTQLASRPDAQRALLEAL